jgi:hypothetical protein
MSPEICPHCGAEVPPRARACPECGSCEETGWSDQATADRLDLPDETFDYNDFVRREFGPEERAGQGIRWGWWVMAVILVFCFLLGILLAGCATSTIESRKQELPAAYAALSSELKQAVDQGQIKVGMNPDAVYLAWGAPAEILTSETESGLATTWLYYGTVMQETRYWTYREVSHNGTLFLERYLERDYNPRDYVRAEIVFVNGMVKSWRTLPRPLN